MTAIRSTKPEASTTMFTYQTTKVFPRRTIGKVAPVYLGTTPLYLIAYLAVMNSARATEGEALVA